MAILTENMVNMLQRIYADGNIPLLEAHLGTLSALMARNLVEIISPTKRNKHYYVTLTRVGVQLAPEADDLINGPSYWDTIHDLSPVKKQERKQK